MLIDTHVHIVSDDQNQYPIHEMQVQGMRPSGVSPNWFREMPVTAEQLLETMDEAGVDRAVLVQAFSAYHYDNSYAATSALRYPGRFISVGTADLLSEKGTEGLDYWIENRKMSGVRVVHLSPDDGLKKARLDAPRTLPFWERVASLGVPVCLAMESDAISQLPSILLRFPKVRIALDHLASPHVEDGPPYRAVQELLALSEFPNLYLKFSNVNLDALNLGGGSPKEFFGTLVDGFGARRLMWGSNFPATHNRSYEELVEVARESLCFLSDDEQAWAFGWTALSLWPNLG